jgi:VanZ family protein
MPALAWAVLTLVLAAIPSVPTTAPAGTDKAAHFALFFVQGLLVVPLVRQHSRRGALAFFAALAAILALGALGEAIQLFVPGRFASISDWSFDALGAIAGLSLLAIPQLRSKNST